MISLRNIDKKFGRVQVLKNLDLDIVEGRIFAILGPNGSGKTTLIKSILGMVIPDGGTIQFNDEEILGKWDYRTGISYLPQAANFPGNLTVKELIEMIKNLRNMPARDEELIQLFGLENFMGQKLTNLSGGTRQKVNIVLAFMFDTPLIILDEPTSGLDPVALIRLKELILKQKLEHKTILITSHIMSFVEEMSDEIVFLLDGQIYFQGSVDELQEQTGQKNLERAIANILILEYA